MQGPPNAAHLALISNPELRGARKLAATAINRGGDPKEVFLWIAGA